MKKSCLIPVGRVVKTHGVRGAVKIYPYGETLNGLDIGEKLLASSPGGEGERELTLVGLRPLKQGWIGEFEEIADMDQALALAGKELFMPEDRLPALPEGEYYHYQLIGLAVQTSDGRGIGVLKAILETGSNDVYVVAEGGKELLIPAIEDVIREVDLENRKIVVDLPEGLEYQ
ncbi:MAG: ribosome maturation factor RimM [Syntrophobacter sp.]